MNKELLNKIKAEFENRFPQNPLLVSSPGRINLIGEHTDYNMGLVFPATIDKYIITALAKSNESISIVYSIDLDESLKIDFNNLEKQEAGSWKNYVIGVISGLMDKDANIENFNLVFGGDIPIGAGLSSSAALENGIVYGLNELFGLGLSKNEMMDISILAEHDFAGVNCGVMDQFSNLHGKSGHAILLDCSDLSFQHIPVQLDDYQLLLINTNVKHQLSDSPYNQRKLSCKTGLQVLQNEFPELGSLSNAGLGQLYSVKEKLSPEVYNRCLYVIEENGRVKFSKSALEKKDWLSFGDLLFASHEGLSKLYEVSCPELDFLVDLAKEEKSVIGSRMMGGGFGGCTINLIEKGKVDDFIRKAGKAYQHKFGKSISAYPVNISDGTRLVKPFG